MLNDYWMVISGGIYDITGFIASHPGGEAILQGCGIDATSLFEDRLNGFGAHSVSAEDLKENYYLGKLDK